VLDVTDADRPANAGRWRLAVEGDGTVGNASVTAAADSAAPDLMLDISDVAALYLGAFRVPDLARAGRVRECRPGAIAAADDLFMTGRPPTNSTMF
jgi:predicted acetyltransferase